MTEQGALVDLPGIIIAVRAFAAITFLRVDMARVAIGAIVPGLGYAVWHVIY